MSPVNSITTPPTGKFAQLTVNKDANNPEAPSPNAIMVDAPEEHLVEPNGAENDDNVAVINPDVMESENTLLANDCMLSLQSSLPCHTPLLLFQASSPHHKSSPLADSPPQTKP